jgi:methionine synthase I (cobalamin-dependent)
MAAISPSIEPNLSSVTSDLGIARVGSARFLSELRTRTLLCDGAMGTLLDALAAAARDGGRPIPEARVPEEVNRLAPERVLAVHRAYLAAGADVIQTNSFGGSAIKLRAAGLADAAIELNYAAAHLARKAALDAGREVWVLGSIGPTGALLEPYGDLPATNARDAFADQAATLAAGGAEAILIETMADLREALAAVEGACDATDLPVLVTFAFEPHGRTVMGLSPEVAIDAVGDAGAVAVGANCGQGPVTMLTILRRMRAAGAGLPLIAQPNAGQPRLVGADVRYDVGEAEFATLVPAFVAAGVHLLGSCCGSTPTYTQALGAALHGPPLGVRRVLAQSRAGR